MKVKGLPFVLVKFYSFAQATKKIPEIIKTQYYMLYPVAVDSQKEAVK